LGGFEQGPKIDREPLSHSHVERGLKRKRAQHIGQALVPRLVGVKPVA
jgi:hypothetical protein